MTELHLSTDQQTCGRSKQCVSMVVCDLAGKNGWYKHMEVPRSVFMAETESVLSHSDPSFALFLWLSAETPDTLVCINLLPLNHL